MGTKNQPGNFDCYANAEPDEPMFVLLARDPDAPALVVAWAEARRARGENEAKVFEALQCAANMREWRARNRPKARQVPEDHVEAKPGLNTRR